MGGGAPFRDSWGGGGGGGGSADSFLSGAWGPQATNMVDPTRWTVSLMLINIEWLVSYCSVCPHSVSICI